MILAYDFGGGSIEFKNIKQGKDGKEVILKGVNEFEQYFTRDEND